MQLVQDVAQPASQQGPLAAGDAVTRSDWQVVLNTGEEALRWRLRAIDAATDSLDLQTFLWEDDPVGHLIHDRILAAADRGVRVRLLIDDSFLAGQDAAVLRFAAHPNVSYRIYNPYKRRSSSVATRTLLNLGEFSRLDHRMHNKIMVADGQVAIVGGRNLADQYFGYDPKANFRDMELVVGGPVVRRLEQSFDQYWNDRWSFPVAEVAHVSAEQVDRAEISAKARRMSERFPATPADRQASVWRDLTAQSYRARVRLIADAPPAARPEAQIDRPVQIARELARLVKEAKSEVLIVSAYLIPTPEIADTLRDAEARGVEVRLLTNSITSNNHLPAYAAYSNHIEELLGMGADVFEMRVDADSRRIYASPPVSGKELGLHAKYLVVDRRIVFVGSANLDPRSLRLNTEVGLILDDPGLAKRIISNSELDLAPENVWRLDLQDQGVVWTTAGRQRKTPPASSAFQQVEAWFFQHLPIEAEM